MSTHFLFFYPESFEFTQSIIWLELGNIHLVDKYF